MHYATPVLQNHLPWDVKAYFNTVAPLIYASSIQIRKKISQYPIFWLTKTTIHLGTLLIDKKTPHDAFYCYATYMELLVQNQWISSDKAHSFKKNYKNPSKHVCLLVLTPVYHHWIYHPYPQNILASQ